MIVCITVSSTSFLLWRNGYGGFHSLRMLPPPTAPILTATLTQPNISKHFKPLSHIRGYMLCPTSPPLPQSPCINSPWASYQASNPQWCLLPTAFYPCPIPWLDLASRLKSASYHQLSSLANLIGFDSVSDIDIFLCLLLVNVHQAINANYILGLVHLWVLNGGLDAETVTATHFYLLICPYVTTAGFNVKNRVQIKLWWKQRGFLITCGTASTDH